MKGYLLFLVLFLTGEDCVQIIDKRETARKDFHEKMSEISQVRSALLTENKCRSSTTIFPRYGDYLLITLEASDSRRGTS